MLKFIFKTLQSMSSIFLAGLFFWVQVAGAVSPQKNKKVGVDYLKESFNEAKKKNSKSFLSEVYEQHRGFFPYELRRELDYRIKKQNPHLPTPEVEAVNQGKNKIIRVRFKEGKNSITFQMTEPNSYELLGSINGKAIRQKFTKDDFVDPLVFLQKMTGTKRTITRTAASVQLLNSHQLSQLTDVQKKAYVDRLRGTLEAAEKAQNELRKLASAGDKTKNALLNVLLESAIAASPAGTCIVAGWAGQYVDGSCQYPQGVVDEGGQRFMKCNDTIYKSGAKVPFSGNRVSETATKECNDQTKDDKYSPYYGIQNKDDFDKKHAELSQKIDSLQEACGEVVSANRTKLPDQKPTCGEFGVRLKELEDARCDLLKENKEKFPGLTCAKNEPPEVPPVLPPEKEEEEAEQPPPLAQDDSCPPGDAKMCKGITKRASCTGEELRCVSCPASGGKTVRKSYCECTTGTPQKHNSLYAHACEAPAEEKPLRGSDRSYDDEDRPRRKKRDTGFLGLGMQNWLALALVGLAGYYAFTQFPSLQSNKPPDPVWPNPPVPPPQTGPVQTPSGTTIPVINTR